MPDSTAVIDELKKKLDQSPDLRARLEASLKQASEEALTKLRKPLREALAWPSDVTGYLEYLGDLAQWAPRQDPGEAWANDKNGAQEIFDRLCHFYFLIDQKVGDDKKIVENDDWFRGWLDRYAQAWGSFLDTEASFGEEQLKSFELSPRYRVQDSMIDGKPNKPGGWLTFNEFFARELNPGLRPISDPGKNATVTAPADCIYVATYPIDEHSAIEPGKLKYTHEPTTVKQLFDGEAGFSDKFAGGTFVHYFLAPYSYHRFHTPVAGQVKKCFTVHARAYLDVTIKQNGQFDAPDGSQDAYEFYQGRGVLVIDTAGSPHGDIGLVAVVPVGMAQISSARLTLEEGSQVEKGDEFGYFQFGGSDIILLFQKDKAPKIDTSTDYRLYGTSISAEPPAPKK
ncbi:MAG: phosphatidylserine decarboxylase [Saccharothrix sp.]|nr:phosphatidylserine decarboxylase [Saccharothrix sp.]